MIEGANVRDGARRRIDRLGGRIGESNRPRAASVVPLRGVACDGRGGGTRGACEAADPIETAELPWKICLEEPLSGMIDNGLRPSPSIADDKVISVVPSRYHLGGIVAGLVTIQVQGKGKEDQTCAGRSEDREDRYYYYYYYNYNYNYYCSCVLEALHLPESVV